MPVSLGSVRQASCAVLCVFLGQWQVLTHLELMGSGEVAVVLSYP
ncbi:hypothetical protein N9A81_01865 [Synechococcus sp. AH-707-M23]|nr:hypothetical protein [Synechococcus sp. AH-707-M23]